MFYASINDPENWKDLLADPEKHWRDGYSAKQLSYSWQKANGFPEKVQSIFKASRFKLFQKIIFLMGFPEHKVDLPGGSRASQNDIFVLAKSEKELVCIVVEGKSNESFGPLVSEWKKEMSSGKEERLAYLMDMLKLNKKKIDDLRYQLLHRTASVIIESKRFNTKYALVLVHAFNDNPDSFSDYCKFLEIYGLKGELNTIVGPALFKNERVFFSWARD
jgi:hypothetical protein